MNYYLAPMEGITGYIYRNACGRHFGGVKKYFTPFLSPHMRKAMTSREKNDILPEHNQGIYVVPQILANNGDAFCKALEILEDLGYREVNLNLGCPSGTVVSKGRGSGFLAADRRKVLSQFLDQIYSCSERRGMKISIKTRLGMEKPEEFEELLSLYLRFPVSELVIHPRVQKDFYKNTPSREAFSLAVQAAGQQGKTEDWICYNGDIFSPQAAEKLSKEFPGTASVMLGRGMIANPGLAGSLSDQDARMTKEEFRSFHDEILEGYREIMSGDRNALFKMKELWSYQMTLFPGCEKQAKKIRKAGTMDSYLAAVDELFGTGNFCPERYFEGF